MNEFSQLANVNLFLDNRLKAKFLYWCGWKITEIAEVLDEKERTVQAWKTRDDWEKLNLKIGWLKQLKPDSLRSYLKIKI